MSTGILPVRDRCSAPGPIEMASRPLPAEQAAWQLGRFVNELRYRLEVAWSMADRDAFERARDLFQACALLAVQIAATPDDGSRLRGLNSDLLLDWEEEFGGEAHADQVSDFRYELGELRSQGFSTSEIARRCDPPSPLGLIFAVTAWRDEVERAVGCRLRSFLRLGMEADRLMHAFSSASGYAVEFDADPGNAASIEAGKSNAAEIDTCPRWPENLGASLSATRRRPAPAAFLVESRQACRDSSTLSNAAAPLRLFWRQLRLRERAWETLNEDTSQAIDVADWLLQLEREVISAARPAAVEAEAVPTGYLGIAIDGNTAVRNGVSVELRRTEAMLLQFFMDARGRCRTFENIHDWREEAGLSPIEDGSIRVDIHRLNLKVRELNVEVANLRGTGYRLDELVSEGNADSAQLQ